MKRRSFIALVSGGAAAWPFIARGQAAMPVIGFLHSGPAKPNEYQAAAFRQGLAQSGYVEGQNVAIEYRWAEGQYDRLAAMAAELVRRPVDVLFCGGPPAALAGKAATTTIPIVFLMGDDPLRSGLVQRLNRPGGNITGMTVFSGSQLGAKHIELLHDMVPAAKTFALLVNPTNAGETDAVIKAVEPAASRLGLKLYIVKASNEDEFDGAFAEIQKLKADALKLGADPLFLARRDRLVALAERYAIPAVYDFREYVAIGGLISYGPSLQAGYVQSGVYTARILKGEKPGDLPVILPTKFELVINATTAKKLGLTVPPVLLTGADEVIE